MKQRMVTRTTLVLDGNVFTTTDPQQAADWTLFWPESITRTERVLLVSPKGS